jgi:hypothetical protein
MSTVLSTPFQLTTRSRVLAQAGDWYVGAGAADGLQDARRLAPTVALVRTREGGTISTTEFRTRYLKELFRHEVAMPALFAALLAQPALALVCDCPSASRCHRRPLADLLRDMSTRAGRVAILLPESAPGSPAYAALLASALPKTSDQASLFVGA